MATVTTEKRVPQHLPSPEDCPGVDVVIYDGKCNFCISKVRGIASKDSRGRFAYLSMHDPAVAQRYPDLDPQRLNFEMCLVDNWGKRYWGIYAIRKIAARVPSMWWLAFLLYIPGAMLVAKWIYGRVARRRYRLGGMADCDSGSCQVGR